MLKFPKVLKCLFLLCAGVPTWVALPNTHVPFENEDRFLDLEPGLATVSSQEPYSTPLHLFSLSCSDLKVLDDLTLKKWATDLTIENVRFLSGNLGNVSLERVPFSLELIDTADPTIFESAYYFQHSENINGQTPPSAKNYMMKLRYHFVDFVEPLLWVDFYLKEANEYNLLHSMPCKIKTPQKVHTSP